MALEIVKPGLATTVQDLGRPGYYHLGIPLSGGMDRFALACANLLVGNEEGDAVLEAVFLGPEIRFGRDATVAVCGAEMPPKVDGEERPTWTAFEVKAGQTLSFGFLKKGARAYVAVSGGVDVPVVLGGSDLEPWVPRDRIEATGEEPLAPILDGESFENLRTLTVRPGPRIRIARIEA